MLFPDGSVEFPDSGVVTFVAGASVVVSLLADVVPLLSGGAVVMMMVVELVSAGVVVLASVVLLSMMVVMGTAGVVLLAASVVLLVASVVLLSVCPRPEEAKRHTHTAAKITCFIMMAIGSFLFDVFRDKMLYHNLVSSRGILKGFRC